ncbi:MAG: PHP domain-containing protein, partial [Dehalococcoidia bacterium]|nr:PHP domain-containing protein [Dehalococcoidia bacterium]
MGKADLHIHTAVSDGMGSVAQVLEYLSANPALDVVAITDHDDITGGITARDMARKMGCPFEVIVGAEITTLEGHMVALFLTDPVPSLRPLAQTVKAVHAQNGICIAPHPMSWFTHSIGRRSLERIFTCTDPNVY